MRRAILRALVVLLVSGGVTAWIGWQMLDRAARHEPDFYQEALRVAPHTAMEASQQLEESVLELQATSFTQGRWQAVFADEQINGWLAEELPRKLPQLLPPGVMDPRVVVEADTIRCACRYRHRTWNFVVSFALNVQLTDESNTLAVRVSQVRAGALPVPLHRYLPNIAHAASKSGIQLRWQEPAEREPVALITIPHQHEDYVHREIYVDSIELRPGQIRLAGRTERQPSYSDPRVVFRSEPKSAEPAYDPVLPLRRRLRLLDWIQFQHST